MDNSGGGKKKLLIIGITMNGAGTEKSFLSFANCLDYEKYDVDLLLAKKEGLFLPLIPKEINVVEMEEYGDMFLLSGSNAARTIWNCFVKRSPLTLFEVLPYFLKILFVPSKRSFTATRLWCRLMQKAKPFAGEYDAAVAYWGDRTMFYMVDKVKAKKKIAWLHFDYSHPPRDDELYGDYFSRCDYVVNVSKAVDDALKAKLPLVAERCVVMENIQNPKLIWRLALEGESFPDRSYTGKRVLSIGRIIEQKGFDFIPPVLKRLRGEGYELRWYIVGDGGKAEKEKLMGMAVDYGVADMMILLGTTINPYPYLRDCDIFALPSRFEGKPITVEEAKIMYKPILATKYLSASEQLDGGRFGVLCDADPDGIYLGLRKLLDSEELRDSLTETLAGESFGNAEEIGKFYKMLDD